MNTKSLKVLEFNKIKELLINKAESQLGKNLANEIEPIRDIGEISMLQQETEEALTLLIKRGNPPLYGINSILLEIRKQERKSIIEEMVNELSVFKYIEDDINNAIISEEEISDNASRTLRNIRSQILSKNDSIKDKLSSIISSQSHKKFLQDSIVTMREGRYVIPVKQENRGSVPGLIHDMSSSGATVFVEPMAVVDRKSVV